VPPVCSALYPREVEAHSAPLAKWLYKNPPFDVLKDFTPIARIVSNPLVLFANPALPAKDLKELIVYAKDNDGDENFNVYAVDPAASAAPPRPHLSCEWAGRTRCG